MGKHWRLQTMLHSALSLLLRMQMVILGAGSPTADYRDRVRTASDLQMMINHDGKERDAAQWAELLTKVHITPTLFLCCFPCFPVP